MALHKFSCVVFHCWVLSLLLFKAYGDGSGISVNFSEAPNSTTSLNSATFQFNVSVDGKEVRAGDGNCTCSHISCKLDYKNAIDCGNKEATYSNLEDGNHKFEVCGVEASGVGCSTYNWIVDTVRPTAYITSPPSFTNAMNFSVNISFTEACIGDDGKQGFKCSSVNACNLLVHGDGQVIPSSLVTLVPKLSYTILVGLSSLVEYGNVTLEMDDNFCADSAGNRFIKAANSTFNVGFDRRSVLVNLSSPVPKKLVQLDTGDKTVRPTNNYEDLKFHLNFPESVGNSSEEILKSMNTSLGTLVPIRGNNHENRTFGFKVVNVSSYSSAQITINFDTRSILTKHGNPVSQIEPITFLYDSQKPIAILRAESNRTRQHIIPIEINFSKPVLGITNSCILINGGTLLSFQNKQNGLYLIEVQFDKAVSVKVRENVTEDVFGNRNGASDALTVTHYSVPVISTVTSGFVTSTFGVTSLATGLLTVSTAGLQSAGTGAFPVPPSSLMSNPAGNLFRSIGHIQVYALSRWLAVTLPVEYYEFSRSLQWSIPYFNLPWENRHFQPPPESSKFQHLERFQNVQMKKGSLDKKVMDQGTKSEAAFLDTQELKGWKDFERSMFWLAVIGGSLILSHVLLILLLKYKRKVSGERWKYYEAIASPRFEICLLILALPCICKASAGLIKGGIEAEKLGKKSGDKSGVAVGSLLLGVVALILLCIVLFLSLGVTLGKLLLYEAVHQAGKKASWYEHILGPTEKGKWKSKNQSTNIYMLLSPLVEDLRGSLNSRSHNGGSVTPADVKEEAEAPGEDHKYHDADAKEEAKAAENNPNMDEITAEADEKEKAKATRGSPQKYEGGNVAAADKKEEAKAPESNPVEDEITTAAEEREEAEAPGGNHQEHDKEITAATSCPHKDDDPNIASANESKAFFDEEKLFGMLRIYYTLLQSVKQVTLGTLAGAYLHQQSTKSPSIILLGITSFQFLFLVILKPFITKLVQLVEMISVACEIGMLTLCLVRFNDELSLDKESTRVSKRGITMIIFFLIGYIPQMIVELYDLFRQIKHLDKSKSQSFLVGLKIANYGLLVILLPEQLMVILENQFPDIKSAAGNYLKSAKDRTTSGSASVRPAASDSRLRKSFSLITVASEICKNIKELWGRWCGS